MLPPAIKTFHMQPVAALRPYIDRLWGWEGNSGVSVPLPTLLPGTGAELYFHYGAPFLYEMNGTGRACAGPGHLFCIRHRTIELINSANVGFIAVRFKIGALDRFTDVPAQELSDRVVQIGELWGKSGNALLRQLSYAASVDECSGLIQAFLLSNLNVQSADPVVETTMRLLYRHYAGTSIEDIARAMNLGRRQLERRFLAFSGQTPSEVRSLCRFQCTVRKLFLDKSLPLADVAIANGYYDQAHFSNDFHRRVGMAPTDYFRSARAATHFYNTPLAAPGMLALPDLTV